MAFSRAAFLFAVLVPALSVADDSLTIAVASNFHATAREIAVEFTRRTEIPVRISSGSTGKLFAQIQHGAPYDIFLAADTVRPEILEDNGIAVAGSRITYAIGTLVLWSADKSLVGKDCRVVLESGDYKWLAIANPRTAPYGAAAVEFLRNAGALGVASSRLVYGENISQAYHFVATGNATLGLISSAQVNGVATPKESCSWPVPSTTHSALDQQAVVLSATTKLVAARQFMKFLQAPQADAILARHGYTVPER